tara:strand:+ start:830 stop:2503 length:1674 start_codon:yes stop_codon:yes gene_type:complete
MVSPQRMEQSELEYIFNSLKPKQAVSVWFNSGVRSADNWTELQVGRKSKSKKYNLEKISLINPKNPKGSKYYLYNRQGRISFAMGDMGTSLIAIKTNGKNAESFATQQVSPMMPDANPDVQWVIDPHDPQGNWLAVPLDWTPPPLPTPPTGGEGGNGESTPEPAPEPQPEEENGGNEGQQEQEQEQQQEEEQGEHHPPHEGDGGSYDTVSAAESFAADECTYCGNVMDISPCCETSYCPCQEFDCDCEKHYDPTGHDYPETDMETGERYGNWEWSGDYWYQPKNAESSETKLCACCKDSPHHDADAVAGDDWGRHGLFSCVDCGHVLWYDDMSKVDWKMNDGMGEVCQPCFDKMSDKDRKEHIGDRVMEDYHAESSKNEYKWYMKCKDVPYEQSTASEDWDSEKPLHDWSNVGEDGFNYCGNCGQYYSPETGIVSDEKYQDLMFGDAWWAESFSADTISVKGEAFYPSNGLPFKGAGYTLYVLGECCVRAHQNSRNYHFCPTCGLSQQLARKMINEDIIFLNDKLRGYSAEHNQTRFYRNLGIGAALVAGLTYWFKK